MRLEGEVAVRCVDPLCPAVVQESIRHFVSRGAMEIDGLGDERIAQLHAAGLLPDFPALYRLAPGQLRDLPGWGARSEEKLLTSIAASRERPLDRFLFALGIRFVGARVARHLAERFGSVAALAEASEAELLTVPEVGERVAASVQAFFADPRQQGRLAALAAAGVAPHAALTGECAERPLAGQTVVLTGRLARFSRAEATALLEGLGARVAGAVTTATDLLIAGEEAGGKLARARQLGVPVAGEEQLLAWAGEMPPRD